MTTASLQMNSSYWLTSSVTPTWGAHAPSPFLPLHIMPGLWHSGQGIIWWIKIMTVRKAVTCQDRATAGILRPWLRLCRSTMIPSTLCILPESLGKELNKFGISRILKMFPTPTASLRWSLPAAQNGCTESTLQPCLIHQQNWASWVFLLKK